MMNKPTVRKDTKKQAGVSHPGMMGDGTEEQNLNERGNPAGRIKKDEGDAAFGKQNPKKHEIGSPAHPLRSPESGRYLSKRRG